MLMSCSIIVIVVEVAWLCHFGSYCLVLSGVLKTGYVSVSAGVCSFTCEIQSNSLGLI